MARPLKPIVMGGGYYPSRKWTPLVYNGGYTTMNGGGEPPEPPTPVYWKTITGVSPLALANALQEHIRSLTQYGKCVQDGTPTPDAPVDIMTNNGAIKLRRPSGMPIAYQMVEWLKPTGPIAITGFKTKSTQEIETVFYRESRGSSYLYSSDTATSGTTNTTAYLTTAGGNWRWDGKAATINPAPGIKITSIQNNDGVWINGTQYGYYTDPGDFVSTNDLKLSSNENTTVRIYSMTIREGETVTLDLVPVQRVTDNAYGFYDKVSGNFYGNSEATFVAGDLIDDPVEIYTDGTPEVLTVSGKQVWNETWRVGTWGVSVNKAQRVVANDRIASKDFIDVKPNTTYTLSVDDETYNGGFYIVGAHTLEGEDGITVAQSNSGKSATFTTSATTNFIGFALRPAYGTPYQSNVILELGSTATDYEPYVTPQTVNDIPMLLGVGDYKDEAEIISGIKTGKIGVKVFDGTENWTAYTASTIVIQNATSDWGAVAGVGGYCTHLTVLRAGETTYAGSCRFATAFNLYDYKTAFGVADVAGFKAKLASEYANGTPVILLFPLAEPVTEQGTAHELNTTEGTNVVSAATNVDPVTLSVEYASSEE